MLSQQEFYEIMLNEFQAGAPQVTDTSEGSILDVMLGASATALAEVGAQVELRFAKTLLESAHGPEVTGGDDDLQTLAVDHYGEEFARPQGTKTTGLATFSRPNADKGDVNIPKGTVVLSRKNADGKAIRFLTKTQVTMVGLTVSVEVEAEEVGPNSNLAAGQIEKFEGSLPDDSITVTNIAGFGGGTNSLSDDEYRTMIYNLLASKQGSTARAVKAKAKAVTGIKHAEAFEEIIVVKEWSIATNATVGNYFKITRVKLYVADISGTASPSLVATVQSEIAKVRAGGVKIDVIAAVALPVNWKAQVTLNALGPNYATLSNDLSPIIDAMTTYLNGLSIGQQFNKNDARAHIMSIFGPTGSDDISDFFTQIPAISVATGANQKIVAGLIEVV